MADAGREKASVHHDSQSNDGADSGRGSETLCCLGAQFASRGFFTTGSSEFDSDRRLFRERGGGGGESLFAGVAHGKGERETLETRSGDDLNDTERHSMHCK